MAGKPAKKLTKRELEIMQVLWSLGQARLGEVQGALESEAGGPLAASTVAMQLNLLIQKGYVTKSCRVRFAVYRPTCTREEATRGLVGDFIARLGLARTPAFLIQLLKNERLTAEDRAALEEILRASTPENSRRPRSRPAAPPSLKEQP